MPDMDEQWLKEIEERCEATPDGPYEFNVFSPEWDRVGGIYFKFGPGDVHFHSMGGGDPTNIAVAELFINARTDMLSLIAEVRRLQVQQELAELDRGM